MVSGTFLLGLQPAAAEDPPPYEHVGTVTEPNTGLNDGFGSFDISWVDSQRDVYYLADRAGLVLGTSTFVTGQIDAVDADDGSFLGYIGQNQFAGNYNNPGSPFNACAEGPRDPRSGPNGVLTDDRGNVWVGDGNKATACSGSTMIAGTSTIDEFAALPNGSQMTSIPIGGHAPNALGNRRADELAFGRHHGRGLILISNPEEVSPSFPFSSLVDTEQRAIIGTLVFDQTPPSGAKNTTLPSPGHGWDSRIGDLPDPTAGGLEQDVWDADDGVFLLNVPGTLLNPGGEIDVISPDPLRIIQVIPLSNCGGSGLALSNNKLVVQCGDSLRVLNEKTGDTMATFTAGAGADEIWFNPGDGNVYQGIIGPPVTSTAGIGVLDLRSMQYLGIVPVASGLGTHSVAADANTNRIFLPMAEGSVATHNAGNGGIGMFHKRDREP
ncbi:MAG: hypothetical protein JO057_04630 [Chloroflexi bacterium]|nr:hypothetical protein [Chloroflexota bacterium]